PWNRDSSGTTRSTQITTPHTIVSIIVLSSSSSVLVGQRQRSNLAVPLVGDHVGNLVLTLGLVGSHVDVLRQFPGHSVVQADGVRLTLVRDRQDHRPVGNALDSSTVAWVLQAGNGSQEPGTVRAVLLVLVVNDLLHVLPRVI